MIPKVRVIVVAALLAAAAFFVHTHGDVAVPVNRPLEGIPHQLDGWTMAGQTRFSERVLDVLRPTDYLYRVYRDESGRQVAFYLGYHAGGPQSGPIHSPKHCLPGSGWYEVGTKRIELTVNETPISLVRAVYQNGGAREMFLYWFQVKGTTLDNEYALKFAEVRNAILHNRRDAAFVRISIPYETDEDQAFAAGEKFIRSFYPQIAAVLPQ